MKILNNDKYLLLIDEEAEIKYDTIIFESDTCLINIVGKNYIPNKTDFKIIAYYPLTKEAKELDLPLLPPFKEDEFSKYYQIVFDYVNSGIRNFGAMMGLFKLKEIAQSKQFSLEDMKKAIEMAREIKDNGDIFDIDSIRGLTEVCTYDWEERYSEEEIIQSLSTQQLPKEFIPEYDEIIVDKLVPKMPIDTIKTITNSEGKEELVGSYKY